MHFYYFQINDTNIKMKGLPTEVLSNLFSFLDTESLRYVNDVSEEWRRAAQHVHDKSWRSLTELLEINPILEEDLVKFGWKREYHCLKDCKCLEIHLDQFPFRNTQTSVGKKLDLYLRNHCVTKTKVLSFDIRGDNLMIMDRDNYEDKKAELVTTF